MLSEVITVTSHYIGIHNPFKMTLFTITTELQKKVIVDNWELAKSLKDVMPNSNVKIFKTQEDDPDVAIFNKVVYRMNSNNNESEEKELFQKPNDPSHLSSIHIKRINIAFNDLQTSVESSTICENLVKVLKQEVACKLNTLKFAIEKEFNEDIKFPKQLPISKTLAPRTIAEPLLSLPVSTNAPQVLSSMVPNTSPNQSLTSNLSSTGKLTGKKIHTILRNIRRNKARAKNSILNKIAKKTTNTEINIDGNLTYIETTSDVQHSITPKNENFILTEKNNPSESIPSIDEDMEAINEILGEKPVQQTILSTETSTWNQDNDITNGTVIVERNDIDIKEVSNKLDIETVQHSTISTNKTTKNFTPFQNALLHALTKQSDIDEIEKFDYDKSFLVSLLPFIKKLNDEQKMKIRIQFPQIIHNISKSDPANTTPHCTTSLPKSQSLKPDSSNTKSSNSNPVNKSCHFLQQNIQQPVLTRSQEKFLHPLFQLPPQSLQQPFPFQLLNSQQSQFLSQKTDILNCNREKS